MVVAENTELQITEQEWHVLQKQSIEWRVKDCGTLFPGAIEPLNSDDDDETGEFDLRVDRAFTVGATGHKRNGKSLFLTRAGAIALVSGLPVWSNYPIEFYYRDDRDSNKAVEKHYISKPLDWNALFTFSDELEYGVVIISEIQQWLDNRASMRLNNRLFSYILRQLGKRHLSLWYDCFSLDTVDKRLPAETDVEVYCEDMRKTYEGKTEFTHLEEGEVINLKFYARTNAWLGFTTYDTGITPEYKLFGKPYWKCYDTSFLFDPFEAMAGIDLDLEKIKITNKSSNQPLKEQELRAVIEASLASGNHSIPAGALWKSAGISIPDSTRHGDLIREMGLIKRRNHQGSFYDLSNYEGESK